MKEEDVAAEFCCCVVDEGVFEAVPRAVRWALMVWSAGVDEAPLWLVHDLGFVLLRGRGTRFCGSRDRGQHLRAARLAYEDRVVAAWLNDPAMLAAHVVIAGLPAEAQERAIAHAIAAAFARGLPTGTFAAHNVGALRTLAQRLTTEDGRIHDEQQLMDVASASPSAASSARLLDAARAVLAGRPLLQEEDLWELAHLEDVPSEAQRLALRTVHRVMGEIGPPASSTLSRLQRRSRDVPVDDEDSSAFPAGGFDAMSTKGTFENLVRSEVAYVGEGSAEKGAPDLFDVRYVEGELLYYTRDESPLLEQKRALCFVVADVERLRHKLKELPTQTLVLVLACCLRAHADLTLGLGPLAVHTTFALGGETAVVEEEQGLLATSLMADIAHRRVAVVNEGEAPARARIVFSPKAAPGAMRGAVKDKEKPAKLWIRVGLPKWIVDDGAEVAEVDASDPAELRKFVDRLILLS